MGLATGHQTIEPIAKQPMADAPDPGNSALMGSLRKLPSPLILDLQACLGNALLVGHRTLGDAPASGGAYALILRLEQAVTVDLPRLAAEPIAPGWYLYAGSAYGPGGLRARLARHFKPNKKTHWHIDRLTSICAPAAALSVPGGHECAVAADLAAGQAFAFAVTGFGASDCRQCRSHLLAWQR